MTDFNLSEKAKEPKEQQISCPDGRIGCLVYHFKRVYSEEDVKEFIRFLDVKEFTRLLKENLDRDNLGIRVLKEC
jgi:hypothetical protein